MIIEQDVRYSQISPPLEISQVPINSKMDL